MKGQHFEHVTRWSPRGSGDIAPFILNLGTRGRWVSSFKLRLVCLWGKNTAPIDYNAGLAPERVCISLRTENYNVTARCPGFTLANILIILSWNSERACILNSSKYLQYIYSILVLVVIQTHVAKSQSSICTTHTFSKDARWKTVGTICSITQGNFNTSNIGMYYVKITNLPTFKFFK
jgi:hypothetical protein